VLTKYESTVQVMDEFFELRLDYYHRRKRYMVAQLENKLLVLENKMRFIRAILDKTIPILTLTTRQLLDLLEKMGFV
jgi:DNA topoisomerase II